MIYNREDLHEREAGGSGPERYDFRSRDQSDSRKEPQAKKCKQHLESGKDKEADSSLGPPDGTQPCQHLDFRT